MYGVDSSCIFESDESDVHVYYQWVNISCMTLCEYMYHSIWCLCGSCEGVWQFSALVHVCELHVHVVIFSVYTH